MFVQHHRNYLNAQPTSWLINLARDSGIDMRGCNTRQKLVQRITDSEQIIDPSDLDLHCLFQSIASDNAVAGTSVFRAEARPGGLAQSLVNLVTGSQDNLHEQQSPSFEDLAHLMSGAHGGANASTVRAEPRRPSDANLHGLLQSIVRDTAETDTSEFREEEPPTGLVQSLLRLLDCGRGYRRAQQSPNFEDLAHLMSGARVGVNAPPARIGAATLDARTVITTAAPRKGEENLQCMICFDCVVEGQQQRRLPCLHAYHVHCIDRWLAQSTLCPLCKHEVTRDGV
eukprot:GEMP01079754.1.p1 GENE.GEMP01079754.1~~GEMP01079754.1.p1  ORF type:complete len:285 (-),score=50.26 GEMP01079754.1:131-985(-)